MGRGGGGMSRIVCTATLLSVWSLLAFGVIPEAQAQDPADLRPERPGIETQPDGTLKISGVTLEEALEISMRWLAAGRADLAKPLLDQLVVLWPDDARVPLLLGRAERALGNEREAANAFAHALNLYPASPVARYELARSLLLLKEWDRSAYHFRFLVAEQTPPEIRDQVARALSYIEDNREWKFSADVSLEPSDNINSAPADPEIDPIFGSGTGALLTQESIAKPGMGVRGRLGVMRYIPLRTFDGPDRRLRVLVGASASGIDQSDSRFDDLNAALVTGVSLRQGRNTFGVTGSAHKRWFGGDEYENITALGLSFSHILDAPLIASLSLSVADRDNKALDALDGTYLTGEAQLRWQIGLTQSINFSLSSGDMDAVARSQSFDENTFGLTYSQTLENGFDLTLGAAFGLRGYDGPDAFFDQVREDEIVSVSAMAVWRDQQIFGFAPYIRLGLAQGESTLKLHEFSRTDIRFGMTSVY